MSFDWINRATSGFTPAEEAVIDASFEIWTNALGVPSARTLEVEIQSAPLSGALGSATNFLSDVLGNPSSASLTIDSSTSFFVDATPFDNSEFVPSGNPSLYNAISGGAVGNWDLLSVVSHELGHALGFSRGYDRLASRTRPTVGGAFDYIGEEFTAALANSGHLDDDFDLMGLPGFLASERALPSQLNLDILNDAYDYSDTTIRHYGFGPSDLPDLAISQFFIHVADAIVIEDLDVALRIDHTFLPDLSISLISPDGTRVPLSSGNGAVGTNYGTETLWTRFDDESAMFAIEDFELLEGTFSPENSLSAIDGELTTGMWTLEVADLVGGDSGQLLDFALIVTGSTVANPADFDGDGVADGIDLGIWETAYGSSNAADADDDGDSDGMDFLAWQRNFSGAANSAVSVTTVPEPTSASSFVIASIALLASRKCLG